MKEDRLDSAVRNGGNLVIIGAYVVAGLLLLTFIGSALRFLGDLIGF
jgi:hypothetical protein